MLEVSHLSLKLIGLTWFVISLRAKCSAKYRYRRVDGAGIPGCDLEYGIRRSCDAHPAHSNKQDIQSEGIVITGSANFYVLSC